jgi:hypothetical protein
VVVVVVAGGLLGLGPSGFLRVVGQLGWALRLLAEQARGLFLAAADDAPIATRLSEMAAVRMPVIVIR